MQCSGDAQMLPGRRAPALAPTSSTRLYRSRTGKGRLTSPVWIPGLESGEAFLNERVDGRTTHLPGL